MNPNIVSYWWLLPVLVALVLYKLILRFFFGMVIVPDDDTEKLVSIQLFNIRRLTTNCKSNLLIEEQKNFKVKIIHLIIS